MATMGRAYDLSVGSWRVRFSGLSGAQAEELAGRWGGFFAASSGAPPEASVSVTAAPRAAPAFLPPPSPGERYRLEAAARDGAIGVRSYAFSLESKGSGAYAMTVASSVEEPPGRTFDNAARWILARLAAERDGLALHGAGVLRGGRAWIFAGPSGAGKTTASRLSAPSVSLGDDFAIVLPASPGWAVPAVPFDNAERASAKPPLGLHPLAGIRRLFQAAAPRVEHPPRPVAEASLLACAAFPWALPDLAPRLHVAVARIAASGVFAHLHFAPDAGFWDLLEDAG